MLNYIRDFLQKVMFSKQVHHIQRDECTVPQQNYLEELLGEYDPASSPAQPPMIWFSLLLRSLWLAPHPKVFSLPNIEEISFSPPTEKRYFLGIDHKKKYFRMF